MDVQLNDIEVHLTQGYKARISHEDVHLLQYLWAAHVVRHKDGTQTVYAVRNTSRKDPGGRRSILLHREIMGVTDPAILVDHQDGDGLNCTRGNLKVGTSQDNRRNILPLRQPGVRQHTNGRWHAHISVSRRNVYLGSFATESEAVTARVAGEIEHWGEVPFRRRTA